MVMLIIPDTRCYTARPLRKAATAGINTEQAERNMISMSQQVSEINPQLQATTASSVEIYDAFNMSSTQILDSRKPASPQMPHLVLASRYLFLVLDPMITFMGTIGNTVMVIVMRRSAMADHTISVYMSGLACADTVVLVLNFLKNWTNVVVGITVTHI